VGKLQFHYNGKPVAGQATKAVTSATGGSREEKWDFSGKNFFQKVFPRTPFQKLFKQMD